MQIPKFKTLRTGVVNEITRPDIIKRVRANPAEYEELPEPKAPAPPRDPGGQDPGGKAPEVKIKMER